MTANSIIEEIKQLGPTELAEERKLAGAELSRLAKRMTASDDPAEVKRLRSAITEGFYGEPARA